MANNWLITGTSSGLGYELTRAVLEHGDNVVATARRPETLDDLVRKYGDQIRAVALDVTDPDGCRAAVQAAVDAFGTLDVVVNNAGYAVSGSLEETPDADFRAQIETNLFGVVNVTKAALPVLRRQRHGHIVQYSSIGGRVGGTPGLGAYQTAKFAVEGYSEVLANEVRPFGVKVTIVEPGGFRTNWSGGAAQLAAPVGPDYEASVGAMIKFREQYVEPGDPARAAKAVIDIAGSDDPPLRLLLGSDALKRARESSAARAAETEKWADVTVSTDYPAQA
ncbi:oxidoreductase [Catellatospora citrea]|uniref:Short-chain dehydrogenase/reductase n=1 Tax=Catellatospora citrea TaxID=53366 RepID=A0A8J3KIJ8_9ACTN|nr:oxidoreductase [Catellatospora citrea]RKE06244.1 short-subunit dehydrogenase [Catellatospora citrea]GIG00583.1 short-chain dehydrogenase/reductase [Catellatospora citrea]